jgi:hypothetical protein
MEIVEMSDESHTRHKWLKWAGLEQSPPQPDSWVPVVRALSLSDRVRGTSNLGDRLVDLLGKAKIEAHQRPYTWDNISLDIHYVPRGSVETHVAVLVHPRDQASAIQIAVDFQKTLDQELQTGMPSDEELTRAALEAGERLRADRSAAEAAPQRDAHSPDRIA